MESSTDGLLFNDVLPLPFKVLVLIELATLLWFSLVYFLTKYTEINVIQLLDLSYSPHNYTQLDRQLPSTGEYAATVPGDRKENHLLLNGIWRNFRTIAIATTIGLVVFKTIQATQDQEGTIVHLAYIIIPGILFGLTLYKLFYKSSNANYKGQYRSYTTFKRILLGRINSSTMRTNDILISDSLMSFSKVLNDFGLFVWKYYLTEGAYNSRLEYLILSIPVYIRLKQCWYEYKLTKQKHHLYNFLKYLTSLGPLTISLYIKQILLSEYSDEESKQVFLNKLEYLNNWWYIFALINSTYSFIWDIKMDWGLELFDKVFSSNKNARFRALRPKHTLYFSKPIVYYLVIILDFCLRFLWILKLFIVEHELHSPDELTYLHIFSTFLFGYDAYSLGYTVIEVLEIFRRWIWCFFKLESDWAKLNGQVSSIELVDVPKQN